MSPNLLRIISIYYIKGELDNYMHRRLRSTIITFSYIGVPQPVKLQFNWSELGPVYDLSFKLNLRLQLQTFTLYCIHRMC